MLFKRHFSGVFFPFNVPSDVYFHTFQAILYACLRIALCFSVWDSAMGWYENCVRYDGA